MTIRTSEALKRRAKQKKRFGAVELQHFGISKLVKVAGAEYKPEQAEVARVFRVGLLTDSQIASMLPAFMKNLKRGWFYLDWGGDLDIPSELFKYRTIYGFTLVPPRVIAKNPDITYNNK